MYKLLKYLVLALTGLMLVAAAQAQTVEAEGAAPIDNSAALAKRMALQDAIRQALMQADAQISTTTVTSTRGVVADNMRFSARGRVTNVVILNEWTDESHYYVKIRAEVPVDGMSPGSLTPQGGPVAARGAISNGRVDPAVHYRRKVALSQFHVLDRGQIHDLPNIEAELARELERRLIADGRVLTVDASQYLLPLNEEGLISQRRILGALPPAREPQQVAAEFAESLGVQFVVTGVIRDMGVTSHFLGAKMRHLELDLFVHDGISGTQVARHRVSESVQDAGVADFPTTTPVMNEKFFASPFGQKVDQVLNKLVAMVVGDVSSQPFTARVIRAKNNRVYIDAGGMANIKVGDVLNTYQLTETPVKDYPGQRSLGFAEEPAANLIVTQVQRLFSVGELDSETARLAPGDVIRFEP